MGPNFTLKAVTLALLITAFCGVGNVFAQQQPKGKKDSLLITSPFTGTQSRNNQLREGFLNVDPPNLVRTFEYNPATNQYILYERVGNYLYRPPRYLTVEQYLQLRQREEERNYFRQLSDNYAYQSQQPGFIPSINVRSRTFAQIFGSDVISIRPQGSAD